MPTTLNMFDGRPGPGAAIGVVPVCQDDPAAPSGCAALRDLRGHTLLVRAVGALLQSGAVGSVAVAVPHALVPFVEELFAARPAVRVCVVDRNGYGHRVWGALHALEVPADQPVVVHDPLFSLASAALVRAVVDALTGSGPPPSDERTPRCVAAVPMRPVTDTLKWVDETGVIVGTADREQFRMVSSPQAYWPTPLRGLLADATPEQLRAEGADVLPRLVQAAGGNLIAVPAPGEVFRLSTGEDLVLADAMSHVGIGAADEPGRSQ